MKTALVCMLASAALPCLADVPGAARGPGAVAPPPPVITTTTRPGAVAEPPARPSGREATGRPLTTNESAPAPAGPVVTTAGSVGGSRTVVTTSARGAGEPEVRHIVIEDDGTRIEELRVRSVPQRIVVTTKGVSGSTYEIITGDGSRDLSDGANTSRGAAGKRVWRVLDF